MGVLFVTVKVDDVGPPGMLRVVALNCGKIFGGGLGTDNAIAPVKP
jgi:hypothetical protein